MTTGILLVLPPIDVFVNVSPYRTSGYASPSPSVRTKRAEFQNVVTFPVIQNIIEELCIRTSNLVAFEEHVYPGLENARVYEPITSIVWIK